MLATRIIPTLLFNGSKMVKGKQFNGWRSVGHIRQAVEIYASREVDELILLDIGATPEGRGPDFARVKELTDIGFTPITVGGGVRNIDDAQKLLDAGADKISIGAGGWCAIKHISNSFGCQAVVASIDYHSNPTLGVIEKAKAYESFGAGEILLTSIDREGTMLGYDIDLIREVSAAVSIPVIAHGGCSGPEDMLAAVKSGASAVAAGAMFQFTDHTPASCAQYLKANGVEVRLEQN